MQEPDPPINHSLLAMMARLDSMSGEKKDGGQTGSGEAALKITI